MADGALPKSPAISRRIYLYRGVDDFMLIYPFYSLMFVDRGLDNLDVGTLVAVWCVAGIALEIPSGVLADRYDRRHVLAGGALLKLLAFAVWLIWPTFTGFLIGFLLWGAQSATQSGTFEALVYDELAANDRDGEYVHVIGLTEAVSFLAVVVSSGVAAVAVVNGYDLLLVLSIAASLLSALLALTIPHVPKTGQVEDKRYFELLAAGWHEAITSKVLLFPIAVVAITSASGDGLEDFVSLFARDVGLDQSGVAISYALMAGGAAAGGLAAHRMARGSIYRTLGLMLAGGAVLLTAAVIANVVGVALLVLFFFCVQASATAADGRLQHSIAGPARATVTSVAGFLMQVLNVAILFSFGWAADEWSRYVAFGSAGAIIVAVACVLLFTAWRLARRLPPARSPA